MDLKLELEHNEVSMPKKWCFWTVVLENTLESLLDSKEIQLAILKEINPEHSLEGLMLKLKLQYFGYLMWRADIGKDPDAGKDWRQEERGWQWVWWLESIPDSMDMNLSKFWEIMENRGAWQAAVHGISKSRTGLSDWTTTIHTQSIWN